MRRFAALLTLLPVAACALVEPHQHVAGLTGVSGAPDMEVAGPLAPVLRTARQQQANYMAAVTAHSAAATAGPLITAALAASSVALTGAGAGSEALRFGLGAGALGVAGGTTLLHNRARQEVYLAGVRALNCVVASEAPFLVHSRDEAALERALRALEASRRTLTAARASAAAARWDNARLDALDARAERAAHSRSAVLADADAALQASALRLQAKIIDVVAVVDQRLIEAGRDPATVLRPLLEGLGGMPGPLAGFAGLGPAPTDGTETAGRPASAERTSATDLAADDLAARLPAVEAMIARRGAIATATPRGARNCTASLRPGQLTVFPDEPVIRVRQLPSTLRFTVRGGVGDRQVSLAGQFPPGSITLSQRVEASVGHVVELALAAGASGAAARLIIADASGGAPIEVEISAQPEAPGPAVTTNPARRNDASGGRPRSTNEGGRTRREHRNEGQPETEVALHPAELAAIRALVGRADAAGASLVKEDRDAIAAWFRQQDDAFAGVLTRQHVTRLLDARRDSLATLTPGPEDTVGDATLLSWRCALLDRTDASPAGGRTALLDRAMRNALFAEQLRAVRSNHAVAGNITLSARADGATQRFLNETQRKKLEACRVQPR